MYWGMISNYVEQLTFLLLLVGEEGDHEVWILAE